MRKWFASFTLASCSSIALANGASAQAVIQVQAEPVQVQGKPAVIQVQAVQGKVIQAQPVQIQVDGVAFDRVAIMPGYVGNVRRSQADAVFVGRVVAIEPMDVDAPQGPNQATAKYRIAIVQVSESIHGLKKDTQTVRVGFIAQANNGPNGNGGIGGVGGNVQIQILPAIQPGGGFGGRRPYIGNIQMNLQIGQDGLFAVSKHHKENFYLSPPTQSFVNRQGNDNFANEVKSAKQLAKVMVNPIASLKAEDKQDRYTAASVLISKYRSPENPNGQAVKSEPIDAEESKLILKALAEGDWTLGRFNNAVANPFELFGQLGINQKDGYNPVNVQNQQQIATAMQKWLDENNGKFRIQKLVVDPNSKGGVNDPNQPQPGVIRPGIRPGIRPLPPVRIQPAPVDDLPAQPAPKQDK